MSKRFLSILFIAGVALALAYYVYSTVPQQRDRTWVIATLEPSGDFVERIMLRVNTEQEVVTARRYAGAVTITIEGEGQVNPDTFHTAFSVYKTGQLGKPFYGFKIDGSSPILRVFSTFPPSLPGHRDRYRFLYPVSEVLRPISFQMINNNPDDKSIFSIEVSIENLVGAIDR